MNIIERWKMAKNGEDCISKKGYNFIKHTSKRFSSTMENYGVPDAGILDDWPEPKTKRSLTVEASLFRGGGKNYFIHHQDVDASGFPISTPEGAIVAKGLVTFDWEE